MSNTEQAIRDKAYEIWQLEGKPDGRSAAHWEMAQQMMGKSGDTSASSSPSRKSRARETTKSAVSPTTKDQQLDAELKDTFPASDPPKVLRASSKKGAAAEMTAFPAGRRPPKTPDPSTLPVDPAYAKKKK